LCGLVSWSILNFKEKGKKQILFYTSSTIYPTFSFPASPQAFLPYARYPSKPGFPHHHSGSFLFLLDFLHTLLLSVRSKPGNGFLSSIPTGLKLLVESKFGVVFSYTITASREYIRRAREAIVEVLAAAENDDQYHHSFRK